MPPAALVLVAAEYQGDDAPFALTLTFDRAIDTGGIDGTQITVTDGAIRFQVQQATGPVTVVDPATVRIELQDIGPADPGAVLLTASDATGIVAADDGGTWDGVTELELPFPAPPVCQITGVARGADGNHLVVSLSQPLSGYDDVTKMIGAIVDGGPIYAPIALDDSDPQQIVFEFADDTSAATLWYVPGADNWHFPGGGMLVDPFSGEIE